MGNKIIAMVDEEFETQLTGNDLRNSITIEDVYNIIKEKQKRNYQLKHLLNMN